jgi:hypothetical protein
MNQSEERLARAFQALAEESPQSAPAEVGLALQNAFRQHHVRRRRRRRLITTGALVACLVVAAVLLSKSRSSGSQEVKQSTLATRQERSLPAQVPSPRFSVPGNQPVRSAIASLHKVHRRAQPSVNVVGNFTSLASYDPVFSKDGFKIVRVGLSSAELSQMGAPSYVHPAGRRVLTDVVLDRDGIPIAVRTVGR